MTDPATGTELGIGLWARRQLYDYDAHTPGSLFAGGVRLSVAEGYQLQSAVAELRCERGERLIGYKVGCTSPGIRGQLGIDHCVTGRLYDSERHGSGTELSCKGYANLAIEGELAVELAHEPGERDFSGAGIPTCVARVIPVIELHNHVLHGDRPSPGELIANNAIHAGFVAGRGVLPEDAMGSSSLAILVDDEWVDGCEGPSLIRTIHSSLRWLTAIVRERGERLGAGQIVLTGSIPGLIRIGGECRIRVDAPPFGSVEARFLA